MSKREAKKILKRFQEKVEATSLLHIRVGGRKIVIGKDYSSLIMVSVSPTRSPRLYLTEREQLGLLRSIPRIVPEAFFEYAKEGNAFFFFFDTNTCCNRRNDWHLGDCAGCKIVCDGQWEVTDNSTGYFEELPIPAWMQEEMEATI